MARRGYALLRFAIRLRRLSVFTAECLGLNAIPYMVFNKADRILVITGCGYVAVVIAREITKGWANDKWIRMANSCRFRISRTLVLVQYCGAYSTSSRPSIYQNYQVCGCFWTGDGGTSDTANANASRTVCR